MMAVKYVNDPTLCEVTSLKFPVITEQQKWGLLARINIFPDTLNETPLEAWQNHTLSQNPSKTLKDLTDYINQKADKELMRFIWTIA
jgi:hypothetical protein